MAITLTALARQVGVDPSLVSRVLRRDPNARISSEKRAAILALAEQTGYRPNRVARSLRTHRTFILGMLTPHITNPFHSWLFRAVERTANAAGYDVILCNTEDDPERFEKVVRTLAEGHVDGLLVATARTHDPAIDLLGHLGLPYVLLNRRREDGNDPWFGPDAFQTGWLGGQHLVTLGHRRIGALFGWSEIGNVPDRSRGYVAALAAHGLSPAECLLATEVTSRDMAYEITRDWLARPEAQRPTAIFAPDTILSGGAMLAIQRGGLRIPADISFVSYSASLNPDMTSLCVPVDEIGERACGHLIGHLAGGRSGPVSGGPVTLPVVLVDRGSTTPLG
ncbi:MAG: LacI family DNA-binding transcriptional regulator [Alphaproteobacteria bacterium]